MTFSYNDSLVVLERHLKHKKTEYYAQIGNNFDLLNPRSNSEANAICNKYLVNDGHKRIESTEYSKWFKVTAGTLFSGFNKYTWNNMLKL